MENNQKLLRTLILIVIMLATFAAILYVYPFNPVTFSVQTNGTNSAKLSGFLSNYKINLSSLSDKDLYYFYGGLPNNTIVFGCNYEFSPVFPSSALLSGTLENQYSQIVTDIATTSMCSVENKTNCTVAYSQLSNLISRTMNFTELEAIFNSTYSGIKNYYGEIVSSGLENNTIVNPLKYDIQLFNSSKNESSMISAILRMKQMTANIVFTGSGKILNYGNETAVYGPFQFPVYGLINATPCSYSKIFNVVTDPSFFESQTYTSIYKSLGNYTNICILTSSNSCNSTEMKKLNMSFYAN